MSEHSGISNDLDKRSVWARLFDVIEPDEIIAELRIRAKSGSDFCAKAAAERTQRDDECDYDYSRST